VVKETTIANKKEYNFTNQTAAITVRKKIKQNAIHAFILLAG
jgi:hypothetical protein